MKQSSPTGGRQAIKQYATSGIANLRVEECLPLNVALRFSVSSFESSGSKTNVLGDISKGGGTFAVQFRVRGDGFVS